MKEIENFLEELVINRNLSNSTIVAYEKDLNDFAEYMEDKNVNIFELKEDEFKEYFNNLKQEFKIASIKRKHSSVTAFYKYLWKNKIVKKIYEYNLDDKVSNSKKQNYADYNKNFDYEYFINSLEDNLYDTRFKVICILVAELNINLTDIFEIQIRDLVKYDFKKIIINRNNKIIDYDLKENIENVLKEYYEKYAFEKRFLFSKYNIQSFRNDLQNHNLKLTDLKNALKEDEDIIYENIKKIYFEIGIGDK